jgi:L-2-hydroxyglutarate oxidase LhgO
MRQLCRKELLEAEPHCGGFEALHVPSTGITDYGRVCAKCRDIIEAQEADIRLSSAMMRIRASTEGLILETTSGAVATRHIVNCAGLQSHLVSRMTGSFPELEIIPFRGEYYDLVPERQTLVRGLIYPVPDWRFPFLGVHFTRRIGGQVDAGPNAVLAFKREGYNKTDFAFKAFSRTLRFPGLWRMAAKYWRSGVAELYRSVSKSAFVRAHHQLVPELTAADLVPGNAGVRAQAVHQNGSLLDDCAFDASGNVLNVCNVPSPAATASIPLGKAIVHGRG